jgi:hypothetical protein
MLEEARSQHSEGDKEVLSQELNKVFRTVSHQNTPAAPIPQRARGVDWVVLLHPGEVSNHPVFDNNQDQM